MASGRARGMCNTEQRDSRLRPKLLPRAVDKEDDQKMSPRRRTCGEQQAAELRRYRRELERRAVEKTKASPYHVELQLVWNSGGRMPALPSLLHTSEFDPVVSMNETGFSSSPQCKPRSSPRRGDDLLPSLPDIIQTPRTIRQLKSPRVLEAGNALPPMRSPKNAETTSIATRRKAARQEGSPSSRLTGSGKSPGGRGAPSRLPPASAAQLASAEPVCGADALAHELPHDSHATALTLDGAEEKERRSSKLPRLPEDGSWLTPGFTPLVSFSPPEIDLLRRYFEMHDADLSSSMSFDEVMDVMIDLGRAPEPGSQEERALHKLRDKVAHDHGDELDFDEFIGFLEAYYHAVYLQTFIRHDFDMSNSLSDFELQAVFADLITVAGFQLPFTDLNSILSAFDQDGNGTIDFTEFCSMMREFRKSEFEHLRRYAGFEPSVFDYVHELFKSADTDSSGCLDISELSKVVEKTVVGTALDSQAEVDKFVDLFHRVDRDKSCSLDFEEFIRLLRVWGNMQGRSGGAGAGKLAPNKKGRRKRLERRVSRALDSLTLHVSQESAQKQKREILAEALAHEVEDAVLAKQWDLLLSEVQMLRETFEFCDVDGSGFIDDKELDLFFANLGYPPRTAMEKAALSSLRSMEKFRGDLDFVPILQLVAVYSEVVAAEVARLATGDDGRLLFQALVPAMCEAGVNMNHESATALFEEAGGLNASSGIDMPTLTQMIRISRNRQHLSWRRTFGFDSEFIQRVTAVFAMHSEKGGINLDKTLGGVLQDLNRVPTSDEQRKVLARAVTRVNRSDNKAIPIEELLLLLRHLDNLELRKRLARQRAEAEAIAAEERALADECHLDAEALQQLRDLFKENDSAGHGAIPLVGIHIIFKDIGIVKTVSQRQHLNDTLLEVAGVASAKLSFLQFLEVLCKLNNSGKF